MNCKTITEQMSEAMDGRLDATQQTAFDAHLAQCPACREAFAALQEAVGLLQDLEPVKPPADLIVGINAAIDRPRGLHVSWNLFNTPPMRVALAASLVLMVGILGVQYLNPAPPDTSIPIAVADAPPAPAAKPAAAPPMMLEEAVAEEDTVVPAEAEEIVDMEVSAMKKEARQAVPRPARKTAPVLADAVDRDKALWNAPAPSGVIRGLSAGADERRREQVAREVQTLRVSPAVVADRRLKAQVEPLKRRAKADAPAVLHIRVAGLSREAVVQAVNEWRARKDVAKAEDKSELTFADSLAASKAAAPATEAVGGERESAPADEVDYIVLHLPRAELDAFLERLRDQAAEVIVPATPLSGAADQLIEIQIQLTP